MKKERVDISSQSSDIIDPQLLNSVDFIVTLCGDSADKCPMTSPQLQREHWGLMILQKQKEQMKRSGQSSGLYEMK